MLLFRPLWTFFFCFPCCLSLAQSVGLSPILLGHGLSARRLHAAASGGCGAVPAPHFSPRDVAGPRPYGHHSACHPSGLANPMDLKHTLEAGEGLSLGQGGGLRAPGAVPRLVAHAGESAQRPPLPDSGPPQDAHNRHVQARLRGVIWTACSRSTFSSFGR